MKTFAALRFSDKDNVCVLTEDGAKGSRAENIDALELAEDIRAGHKAALCCIPEGAEIIKYGAVIGRATQPIKKGAWVHTHNVSSALEGSFAPDEWTAPAQRGQALPSGTFMGYDRGAAGAGIRNDLWVIPAVGCAAGLLENIVKGYTPPRHITGVKVLRHPWGCSQLGGDLTGTRDLLCALAMNTNCAGALIVGLGCENLTLSMMEEKLTDCRNYKTLMLQELKDEETAVTDALDMLAANAEKERTELPLSSVRIGIKCGGSDAFSSITGNPLLGRITDWVTGFGGSVLMGEIPEMFGAEKGLLARTASKEVFLALTDELNNFRKYFTLHGQPVCENPSPGNHDGGITTLEEKSLGAVSKSGSGIVTDVLKYGQRASKAGLSVVSSPGNDLVSCTALAAAGASLILFTTGRGTPFGTVVPTVKISTNRTLAERKPGWIDFDASCVLTEGMDEAEKQLKALITETAEGRLCAHEKLNIGDISIFKDGVIL